MRSKNFLLHYFYFPTCCPPPQLKVTSISEEIAGKNNAHQGESIMTTFVQILLHAENGSEERGRKTPPRDRGNGQSTTPFDVDR